MVQTLLRNDTKPRPRRNRAVQTIHDTCNGEGYRARTSVMLECTPLQTSQNIGKYDANTWYTDKAILLQNETDAFAMDHSRRHVSDTSHLILLRRMLSGHLWGRVGDTSTIYSPGPIHVQDQEMRYAGLQDRAVFQSAFIFKSALGFHPSRHLRSGQINPESVAGQCLVVAWEALFDQLWAYDTYVDAELFDRFLACVQIALGAPAEREDVRMHARNALYEVICRYIETNLGDYELAVPHLLHKFGVSRASLYRMFEDAGGVRNYIRQRRATRALLDVSRQPDQRGIIRAVAEQ